MNIDRVSFKACSKAISIFPSQYRYPLIEPFNIVDRENALEIIEQELGLQWTEDIPCLFNYSTEFYLTTDQMKLWAGVSDCISVCSLNSSMMLEVIADFALDCVKDNFDSSDILIVLWPSRAVMVLAHMLTSSYHPEILKECDPAFQIMFDDYKNR